MTIIEKILDELGADVGDTLIVQKGKEESVYNLVVCESYTSNEKLLSLCNSKAGDTWEDAINDLFNMEPYQIKVKKFIKSCPFCGGRNVEVEPCFVSKEGATKESVLCHDCKTNGPIKDTCNEAIKAWNKARR